MVRIIGVVSGKGGVGKTTLVSNLGVALSKFGMDVTLIDCNITTSHLGFCFGLYEYSTTLNDVLKGNSFFENAIISLYGVKIIPASLSLEELIGVDIDKLKDFVAYLPNSDIVLLDSAPGFGKEALAVLNACNEIIFVTIPYMNAVTDIVRSSKILGEANVRGIVVNMWRGEPYELSSEEIEEITGFPVIAKIPFDKNVQKSLAHGVPTVIYQPNSSASVEIMKLASKLVNKPYSPPKTLFLFRLYNILSSIFGKKQESLIQ